MSHLAVFNKELSCFISIGVIEKAQCSEWIARTFNVPKKDGRIRWITDFRGLNKSLSHKVYPLRKISEIFQCHLGYQCFTKLDISMQYYTFVLDSLHGTFVPSHHHLGFTATVACPWALANPLTLRLKLCIPFWMTLTASIFTWMILGFLVQHGLIICPFFQPF